FMSAHYPQSIAVRQALVYALFVERAGSEQPAAELVQAFGKALAGLPKDAGDTAPWLELARAQQAIDSGDLTVAREAFARFNSAKKEKEAAPELTVYVEDIDRYLRSHP